MLLNQIRVGSILTSPTSSTSPTSPTSSQLSPCLQATTGRSN